MSYVPDPTDETQPEGGVDSSTAAAEFRALKAYVQSIVAPSAILKNQKRQTVVAGSVDANGQPNFLAVGSGLNFNINAATTNLLISFASGFDVNGSIDQNTLLNANVANQGSLTPLLTNYLFATYVNQGAVNWASTLLPPQYGSFFNRSRNALLQWDNNILDDYGNTWTAPAGNSFVSGGTQKFGTYALSLNGTTQYITNSEISSLPENGWEISGWFNSQTLPIAGATQTLFNFTNAGGFGARVSLNNAGGTIKLQLALSSNGTTNDIANNVLGTNTVWSTNTWYKVRLIFDKLASTYRLFLSNNGAAETQDASAASALRVCPITMARIGASNTPNNFWSGYVDCFHFSGCARAAGVVTPAATPDTPDGHWFDTSSYKMKEVTAASTVAGQNPVFTEVNRVFVGEADAATITLASITAYALNGYYDSGYFQVTGVSTTYTKEHKIGTPNIKADLDFSEFSDGTGWKLFTPWGDVAQTAGQIHGTPVVAANAKSVSLRSGATSILGSFTNAAGVAVSPTVAFARVVVERNF